MNRLTKETPSNNQEALFNCAYAKDHEVVLRYADGEEDIRLVEYLSRLAKERGCDCSPEDILNGDACRECDCEVEILNTVAIQAAELRGRLMAIEDILGEEYDLDQLRKIMEAERDGRVVVLPCKPGEYWRDQNGDRVRIETVSFCRARRLSCDTHMVTYSYEDEGDDFAVNWIYFHGHFTREEAENLEGGGDHE